MKRRGWIIVGCAQAMAMWLISLPGNNVFAQKGSVSYAYAPNRDTSDMVIDRIAAMLEESLAENGEDGAAERENAAMVLEYFGQLLEKPLNINRAKKQDLERLLILSDFQIESLLDYRRQGGDILSAAELALLNGFDQQQVALLMPFIRFGSGKEGLLGGATGAADRYRIKDFFRDCHSSLFFKGNRILERDEMYSPISKEEFEKHPNSRYLGTPYYMQLRYKCEYAGKIEAGFTLENDAGERFFSSAGSPVDFFSFHIALKDMGKMNTLVIGDFSARFGQGLTVWNSFNLYGTQTPMGFYKRGAPILPSTSSDENRSFRGAAAYFSFKNLDIAVMLSYNKLDARVKDGVYTSILTGGLHNTISLLESRKAMGEGVGGVTASYLFKRIKIGASFAVYGYDKENGRDVTEYNKYQMYNGIWGNASFHFYTIIKRLKLFGEWALDFGRSCAALLGAVFPVRDKWEMGVLLRRYSKSYIAPHAAAYSTISSCSNQSGLAFNCIYNLSRRIKITANADVVHYPWFRYNVHTSSSAIKGAIKLEYTGLKWNGYIRFSNQYATYGGENKLSIKGMVGVPLSATVRVNARCETVYTGTPGWQGAVELRYDGLSKRVGLRAGGAWFDCGEWKNRLYLYENDLPYTYSSRLLYGRGMCGYVLLKVKPLRSLELYAKIETVQYFTGDKPSVSKIKLGSRLNF